MLTVKHVIIDVPQVDADDAQALCSDTSTSAKLCSKTVLCGAHMNM